MATRKATHRDRGVDEDRQRLFDLLRRFDTAMVAIRDGDRGLHARPMPIAHVEPGGSLYFATDVSAVRIDEISAHPEVVVTMQSARSFASLTGRAHIVCSHGLIQQLWDESWRPWFGGRDDPRIVLLGVEPYLAEYWDSAGADGISFLFDAVRAAVTGESVRPSDGPH